MDDTISRQAAISICDNAIDLWNGQLGTGALDAVRDAIMELPSAEPERKKGKWIATQEWGGRNYSCSCCKFSFIVDTCMLEPMWNFCPNCGAEIEGRR